MFEQFRKRKRRFNPERSVKKKKSFGNYVEGSLENLRPNILTCSQMEVETHLWFEKYFFRLPYSLMIAICQFFFKSCHLSKQSLVQLNLIAGHYNLERCKRCETRIYNAERDKCQREYSNKHRHDGNQSN